MESLSEGTQKPNYSLFEYLREKFSIPAAILSDILFLVSYRYHH